MANVQTLQQLIDNRLTPMLGYIQSIEAPMMLCQPTGTPTRVQCPYGNWNTAKLLQFVKNGSFFTPDGYNATTGTIDDASRVAGDDIFAMFTFSYFGNSDLQNFFKLAISRLNNAPPFSSYTLDDATTGDLATYPLDTEHYLCMAAYKQAIDTLMMDLMGWRAAIIFRNGDSFSNFLQAKSSEIDAYLTGIALTVKGRRNLMPHSVSAGRWKVPQLASDHNFQQFTVIRA